LLSIVRMQTVATLSDRVRKRRNYSRLALASGVALGTCCALPLRIDAQSVPPLSMAEPIQLALAHNRSIQIAAVDVKRSDAEIKAASTRRLPSFAVFAEGGEMLLRPSLVSCWYVDEVGFSLNCTGRLCTNCARMHRFQQIEVTFEPRPPLRGGYMTQKLSQRTRWLWDGVARLESEGQRGLAAKCRFFSLERFCPTLSMAPVMAIV
jgi:hypothetical protein